MKSVFTSAMVIYVLLVKSQTCGDIYYQGIIPAPLDDTTEAFLNLQVYCNEFIHLENTDVVVVGNDIMIDAYYCWGWMMIITTTNDTIPLGVLPAGNYNYTLNVWTSYQPTYNCLAYVTDSSATGTFDVSHVVNDVGIDESANGIFFYVPANRTLGIHSQENIQRLTLYSIDGKRVLDLNPSDYQIEIPDYLSPGTYIISASIENSHSIYNEKIVLGH